MKQGISFTVNQLATRSASRRTTASAYRPKSSAVARLSQPPRSSSAWGKSQGKRGPAQRESLGEWERGGILKSLFWGGGGGGGGGGKKEKKLHPKREKKTKWVGGGVVGAKKENRFFFFFTSH